MPALMRRPLLALLVALAAGLPAACDQQPRPAVQSSPELDALFERLAEAGTPAEAGVIEEQIWAAWARTGSATLDVLIERADAAEAAGDKALALRFVTEVSELAPDYAGAFYRRSILRYEAEDKAGAIADVEETLKREPRHFGALAGLALIYEDMGREKDALDCYRRALAIHPWLDSARQGVRRLEPKVEGQDT